VRANFAESVVEDAALGWLRPTRSPRRAYLKIPGPTIRSWVMGRDYRKQSGNDRFSPVITLLDDPGRRLSSRNLIELAALRELTDFIAGGRPFLNRLAP